MKYLLLPILMFLSSGTVSEWGILSEEAKGLSQQGYHSEAAELYENAWLSDETQVDLLVSAGEEYMQARMYADAARVLDEALLDGSQAPFLQYKLGLALKSHGNYAEALTMLSESLQIEATGSYLMKTIIRKEIDGCRMAMKSVFSNFSVKINLLNNEINSSAADYAPLAATGDKLYFGSHKSGSSQIYETVKLNGSWTTPASSKDIASIVKGNYNGGTFNKDMTEFYFSVCDPKPTMSAVGSNCKIFKSKKSSRGWGKAVAMRDYINWSEASTSHPTIVYEGDTEVLYFTTDRKGGQGGMDIWYATREVNSDDIDFSFPVNAGPVINTVKNDVTPYYDRSEGKLYFSSDGHETAGGLDVFQVSGKRNEWTNPKNMGAPVNSSADDYYYNTKVGSTIAFLTSNRLVEGQKQSADDDIFEIDFSATEVVAESNPITSTGIVTTSSSPANISTNADGLFMIKGRVTDALNGNTLGETYITLYKAVGESNRRKIETIKSEDGKYRFSMQPGEYYIVEAYKPAYKLGDFEFNTEELDSGISIDIPLDRAKGYASAKSKRPTPSSSNSPSTSVRPPSTTTTTPSGSTSASTTTPRPSTPNISRAPARTVTPSTIVVPPTSSTATSSYVAGTEYRIQLTAVGNYNPMLPIFSKARQYGSLATELHPNGTMTRVFLSSFETYDQAKSLVDTMKSFGFDTAFVVKYQDGQRRTL